MHRRSSYLNSFAGNSSLGRSPPRSGFIRLARRSRPVLGYRWHSCAPISTGAIASRYRLEHLGGSVLAARLSPPRPLVCEFAALRIRNNQPGRCEPQGGQLRSHRRGIDPDVVRREMGTPQQLETASHSARQYGSELPRMCFLRHFLLAQPYF